MKNYTREVVARVNDEDERVDALLADMEAGRLTLEEAVEKANKMLREEYSELMHDFVWDYGGYLDRMIEEEEKKKWLASLSEEERAKLFKDEYDDV